MSIRQKKPRRIHPRNVGVGWQRTLYDYGNGRPNLEKIYMEKWDRENSDKTMYARPQPLAQMLMHTNVQNALELDAAGRDDVKRPDLFTPRWNGPDDACVYYLSRREYQIIATMIQWLGSNVGFAFVEECLREAGYMIVIDPEMRGIKKPKKPFGRFDFIKRLFPNPSQAQEARDE